VALEEAIADEVPIGRGTATIYGAVVAATMCGQ
jgi:hypothetical protein